MIKPCKAVILDRMQLIKTEDDKEFRFSKVMLVKPHLFSKKIFPYDAVSGSAIIEMKHFHEADKVYLPIEIDSLKEEKRGYSFNFICKEENCCG